MKNLFSRFRIPTLLGLTVIALGIAAGILLSLKQQTFISQASPDLLPQNITVSNVSDTTATISWQTSSPSTSFIRFGQNSLDEQTVLDDRDQKNPKAHLMHFVSLKNLSPKTIYEYRVVSNTSSDTRNFTTATPISSQTGFQPIIGSVVSNNLPLNDALVYLSIADAATQAALTKNSGNFLIPISQIRKKDLSGIYPLTPDTVAKLVILSDKGTSSVLFKLSSLKQGLPSVTLGENLDLTNPVDNIDYDLNKDGKINSADMAVILENFGPQPKNPQNIASYKKADLNGDGAVNQKDIDLMLDAIKKSGNQ